MNSNKTNTYTMNYFAPDIYSIDNEIYKNYKAGSCKEAIKILENLSVSWENIETKGWANGYTVFTNSKKIPVAGYKCCIENGRQIVVLSVEKRHMYKGDT